MRRRRRLNTQTVKRKPRGPAELNPVRRESKGWFRRIFVYVLIPAMVIGSAYYYQDDILNWLSAFKADVKEHSVDKANDIKPSLPVEEEVEETAYTPIEKRIQVEVLNGCGEQGVAGKLADKLKSKNYDVVNMGNYIKQGKAFFKVEKTKIVGQSTSDTNRKQVSELATFIGVDGEQVDSINNPAWIADITIIIGHDYKSLTLFKK